MRSFSCSLFLVLLTGLATSSATYAQVNPTFPTDPLQQRIDSLRRTVSVRQDRSQAYHDSVLQALQQRTQRGEDFVQQRIDSLRRTPSVQQDPAQRYHDSVLYALQRLTPEATQARIDSVRQTLAVRQDQAQAYHDSVLHYLQTRGGPVAELLPDAPSGVVPTASLNDQLPALPAQPALPAVPALPSADQLATRLPTPEALDQLRSVAQQATQYSQSVSEAVQTGQRATQNVPAHLEKQLTQQPDVQMLTQQEALKESASPEVIAEQMQQQVRQGVKQHLANHTEAIAQGEKQLAQLKRKYTQVQTEQERYEKAVSLKKEAWAARLLLGTYVQVYGAAARRQPEVSVDVSPFMGYRFNTRWSVGVGASYRIPATEPLYQGRAFVESVVYRGLLLHAAYERSWQPQPGDQGQSIVVQHDLLAGVGKTYRITKKLRGTTLLLFRPDREEQPLSLPRWNLRTGVFLSQ